MRAVFVGPPGAGKGTQCRLLAKHLDIPHLSTGSMLRSLDQSSEIARQVVQSIGKGNFAPDDLILEMVSERLQHADCSRGYILDGFPRTLVQANRFDAYLQLQGTSLDHVFQLDADRDILTHRLLRRAELENREDDDRQTIASRFQIYTAQTAPILAHYQQQQLVRRVDADASPDTVFRSILKFVESD